MKISNVVLALVLAVIYGCVGSGNGELIGTQNRPVWNPTDPYGMIFVPQGSFNMGPGYQDVPYANSRKSKTVSVAAFYMDVTEITNNEYRQFVFWVRDSIAHVILGMYPPEDHIGVGDFRRDQGYLYKYKDKDHKEVSEAGLVNYPDYNTQHSGKSNGEKLGMVNWTKEIDYDDRRVMDVLISHGLFIADTDKYYGRRALNAKRLKFAFEDVDVREGAKKENRDKQLREFVIKYNDKEGYDNLRESVEIYPDTLVWVHDYAYSYNEPWTRNYFHHPAFDEYPVVGINWHQARAFSQWRTMILDDYLLSRGEPLHDDFRLPTETEWEYAARGGLDNSPYPWGGPYTVNEQGCYLANFKPRRGNYSADGGVRTVAVASYNPNAYGLYDMSGNVAEWTSNTYDESSYAFTHDMNSDMDFLYEEVKSYDGDHIKKRKVIRGGSWKDISYFMQTGTRTYEYQDTAKSYIGFRNVISYLGRDKSDLN